MGNVWAYTDNNNQKKQKNPPLQGPVANQLSSTLTGSIRSNLAYSLAWTTKGGKRKKSSYSILFIIGRTTPNLQGYVCSAIKDVPCHTINKGTVCAIASISL